MRLFLCEKPSQGRDIAKALGANDSKPGYLRNSQTTVTWAFGHLLEMAPPDAYDPALKKWSMDSLPILPNAWKYTVKKDAKKQMAVISRLIDKASEIVIATDADREGEVIARELLDYCRYQGPVRRLWLSSLDPASIKKALADLRPGSSTEPLYFAGLARGQADWLVGMNLTRFYTLLGKQQGHDSVLSVGRVQTPTLRLVVDRDASIEHFTPVPYWVVSGLFESTDGKFWARWKANEDACDDDGHCIHKDVAERVLAALKNSQQASVSLAETTRKRESAPLPFSLSGLQQLGDALYGISAQDVLTIAQALYEKYKATTYPRTDCAYLPTSQLSDAPEILQALGGSDERIQAGCAKADLSQKSRAWNDSKITAHHAIIPTAAIVDVTQLSENEFRVYDLIRRYYIAQFYPRHEYDQTLLEVACAGHLFIAKGRVSRVSGWKDVIRQNAGKDVQLPDVKQGDRLGVNDAKLEEKQTKPPEHFSDGTLIAAMKNVGRFISDEALKKILKDSKGIGTEATRPNIIETLLSRQFLQRKKKHLVSTPTGRMLIAALPDDVSNPETTAIWEHGLAGIEQQTMTRDTFMENQANWISHMVSHGRQATIKVAVSNTPVHNCPECGQRLHRRKGKTGFFWGCSGYPECKYSAPDNKGKPGKKRPKTNNRSNAKVGDSCPECSKGLLIKKTIKDGKNAGKEFIGCNLFPKCRFFSWLQKAN